MADVNGPPTEPPTKVRKPLDSHSLAKRAGARERALEVRREKAQHKRDALNAADNPEPEAEVETEETEPEPEAEPVMKPPSPVPEPKKRKRRQRIIIRDSSGSDSSDDGDAPTIVVRRKKSTRAAPPPVVRQQAMQPILPSPPSRRPSPVRQRVVMPEWWGR